MKLKEKLFQWIGPAAYIVWYIISFVFNFAPLFVMQWGILINVVLLILMTAVPFVNVFATAAVWIWALVVTIKGPQDVYAIIYYVLFVIQMLWFMPALISTIATSVAGLKGKK